MILDGLDNAGNYVAMHGGFRAAFAFLGRAGLNELPAGRYEIDGDRVYATVAKEEGRSRIGAKLEAHKKHIDIQFLISGSEEMGWKARGKCAMPQDGYNTGKDVEFFADRPDSWIRLRPGSFAIFFPYDAHAPLVGAGEIHKVVVKVLV